MRTYMIHTYYYDRGIRFYFGQRIRTFYTKKEAMEYLDKILPINEMTYSFDLRNETRGKKITYKYVMYAELEIF